MYTFGSVEDPTTVCDPRQMSSPAANHMTVTNATRHRVKISPLAQAMIFMRDI